MDRMKLYLGQLADYSKTLAGISEGGKMKKDKELLLQLCTETSYVVKTNREIRRRIRATLVTNTF